jgi:nucleoside-diphosphate-sugar epimerase
MVEHTTSFQSCQIFLESEEENLRFFAFILPQGVFLLTNLSSWEYFPNDGKGTHMNILITGITGFIGGHLCQRLIDEHAHRIVALVRPGTTRARYARFVHAVDIKEIELTNSETLHQLWSREQFDCVFHLAAVRGGGAASHQEFDRSNIEAPVVLATAAHRHDTRFLFCSSVGVFGTIPQQLPPTEDTPKVGDNYYHASKIEAERRLIALQSKGLRLTIIRPIITYGPGDRGFPFQLVHLTAKGVLLLPTQDIQIHLVDVQTLVDAFLQAATRPEACEKIYTITDQAPVSLRELVQFISTRLAGKRYPPWKLFPTSGFRVAEYGVERILKSDAWLTRVKLMSRDWFYDGTLIVKELGIQPRATIPNFASMIDWYQHVKRET